MHNFGSFNIKWGYLLRVQNKKLKYSCTLKYCIAIQMYKQSEEFCFAYISKSKLNKKEILNHLS